MHAGNRINISLKCILRSPRSHGYCVSISVYTWAPIFHWIILLFRQSRYIRARQRIILRQRGQARCCMHNTVNLSQGRRVKNHFTQPQPGKSNPARKTYLFRWSIKMFRCLDVKGTASVHTYLFTHLFFSHPRNAMPLPRYQGKGSAICALHKGKFVRESRFHEFLAFQPGTRRAIKFTDYQPCTSTLRTLKYSSEPRSIFKPFQMHVSPQLR